MTDFTDWHAKNWTLERVVAHEDCWDELKEAYEAGAASQFDELPDGLTVNASELNAPAIHIQNDAGDWAKIEYDGTFTCSNPDAVTELAELFWNHLATLGPLFGANKIMTTWQPIKTAPKDGRVKTYMVYAHGMAITATKFKSCWMNKGEEIFPTHWMPLPAAPTEDK